MPVELVSAVATAFGGISIAGVTYWFTKQRERDAELRKEKLEHYKEFVASLNGVISGEDSPDGQRAFAKACNKLMLVAPQNVIEALRHFQQEIKISNPQRGERHDELMSNLFLAMRRDLRISPSDDSSTFVVGLWSAGVKSDER